MDYLQYSAEEMESIVKERSFKPYYKWITFNTMQSYKLISWIIRTVLNLIINGLPSILDLIEGVPVYGVPTF